MRIGAHDSAVRLLLTPAVPFRISRITNQDGRTPVGSRFTTEWGTGLITSWLNTGDIFSGLYYPIGIAVMTLLIGVPFLPETKDRDITL